MSRRCRATTTRADDAQWHPLAIDHEVIRVRGSKDVILDVKLTAHGPLLNPILIGESRPIALAWTLFDPSLTTLPIYPMNVAANWTEFSAALGQWCWPTQNVVYSDDQGHIAYHAVGRVPIRSLGLANVPIHDPSPAWQGYIPFDDMPNAFDPPSGFLATANSRVTTTIPSSHSPTSGPTPTASSAFTNLCKAATGSRPPTCSPSRPTSTAKSIRRWAIASPTPSTTPPALMTASARPPT
jgi:acyl-homoserine lactone acylase PvdQ